MSLHTKSRWSLSSLLLLGPVLLALSGAGWAFGDIDPEPLEKKCCKPATAQGPGGNDCPAPPCRPAMVCNNLVVTGTWGVGGCQTTTKESECTDTDTDNVYRPIVQCKVVPCPNGAAGFTCGWVQIGTSTTEKQDNVKSCNGQPCS